MKPLREAVGEPSQADRALVILVEDDAGVRDALAFLLETDGFRTRAFRTGMILLAQPDLAEADCFVLDYHLPGLSGIDVLSRLRDQGVQTPAVFVTSGPDPILRRRASELGAVAVLEKPLADDALTQTILHALDRPRLGTPPSL